MIIIIMSVTGFEQFFFIEWLPFIDKVNGGQFYVNAKGCV